MYEILIVNIDCVNNKLFIKAKLLTQKYKKNRDIQTD
jgi:hypothetical protein